MQKKRTQYPGKISSWMEPISYFAIFFFTIAIGTIDSHDTGPLHTPSAVIFFVLLYILTLKITFLIKDMRKWDATVVSNQSWFFKRLTCWYLTLIWSYCFYGLVFDNKENK
jgi:hypothetical protein